MGDGGFITSENKGKDNNFDGTIITKQSALDEGFVLSEHLINDDEILLGSYPVSRKPIKIEKNFIIEFLTVLQTNILSELNMNPKDPYKIILNINGVDAYYGISHDFLLFGKTIAVNPTNLQYNIEVGDTVIAKYYI